MLTKSLGGICRFGAVAKDGLVIAVDPFRNLIRGKISTLAGVPAAILAHYIPGRP